MADTEWTTEDVRAVVREASRANDGMPNDVARAETEFNAWLAAHDAEVAARALEDAAEEFTRPTIQTTHGWFATWLRARAAALRGGSDG